ncbi:DinB family protein [Virgibacillus sp. DJP39]|uniref:DinB family protein n=1 Tax=Virgibacillus sp. DJP39 TaxID=3409790 RepID=UPI003BB6B51D
MEKEFIINEKSAIIDWVLSLKKIDDALWFAPFAEGKWGIADVISHLIAWDHFMIDNRLTYVLKNEPSPSVEVDVESVNQQASNYARSGISKNDLINAFVSTRSELVSILEKISTEAYSKPLPGIAKLTLSEYLAGNIKHDLKHKEEIDLHIETFKG